MKIGLYFGTFDPIHFGHINIGELLVKKGILNKVWFVVTPQNPDKSCNNIVDFVHRYEMAKIQLKRNSNLLASDIELNLEKPNYTINTLNYISKKFPNYRFSIIMGEDNFMNFTYWKNYKEILNNYDIYVYPRGGNRKENTELIHSKNVHKIEAPYVNISSSEIRKLINNKENLSGFISEEIYNYIIKNKLYIS
tara:strand:- start:1643 stop:2224 length:582 start_codon:yes stop_codon:yes gene_type:complete